MGTSDNKGKGWSLTLDVTAAFMLRPGCRGKISSLTLVLSAGIHGLPHRDASFWAPGVESSNGGFQQVQVSPSLSVNSMGVSMGLKAARAVAASWSGNCIQPGGATEE